MHVIDIEYGDDNDSNEFFDLIFREHLSQITDTNILIGVTGARSNYEKLQQSITHSSEKYNFNFLFFGKNSYNTDSRNLLYVLRAVKEELDRFSFFSITREAYSSIDFAIWNDLGLADMLMEGLNGIRDSTKSVSTSFRDIEFALQKTLSIAKKIQNDSIRAALTKSVSIFIKLNEIEGKVFYGKETRNISEISRSGCYEGIRANPIAFKPGYQEVLKELHLLIESENVIKNRFKFLENAELYEKKLNDQIDQNELPLLLVWLSVYFLTIANIYADRNAFSAGLSLNLRSLEFYCQGILIFKGSGAISDRGRYMVNGSETEGIGKLWDAVKDIVVTITDKKDINNIDDLVRLRNKSIFGHGVTHINREIYEKMNISLRRIISNCEEKISPPPKVWEGLIKLASGNPFVNAEKIISGNTLSLLGI